MSADTGARYATSDSVMGGTRADAGAGVGAGAGADGGNRASPSPSTAVAADQKARGVLPSQEEATRALRSRFTGRLHGKVGIVTGGGQGIGAAIVKRFVEEGCSHVAVFDVDEEHSRALVSEATELARAVSDECSRRGLESTGCTEVQFFMTNMADEEAVARSVSAVIEWAGGIDILVNNAATFIFGEVQDVTDDAWDKVRVAE